MGDANGGGARRSHELYDRVVMAAPTRPPGAPCTRAARTRLHWLCPADCEVGLTVGRSRRVGRNDSGRSASYTAGRHVPIEIAQAPTRLSSSLHHHELLGALIPTNLPHGNTLSCIGTVARWSCDGRCRMDAKHLRSIINGLLFH